jgi:thiamine biosynthesis lipoprotein ApbE
MQEGLFVFETDFVSSIIEKSEALLNFIIYPNPSRNSLTITTTVFQNTLNYSIVDLSGKAVINGQLEKTQSAIDLSTIAQGFYVLSITNKEGSVVTKKFIKE